MKNLIAVSFALTLFAMPAFADKPNHGKHAERNGSNKSETYIKGNSRGFLIPSGDKQKILSYLENTRGKKCPPGLAKKNNGCLPPGQAKRYAIGHRLTTDNRSLPQKLLDILSPPPQGSFYRMVDNDVVLVSQQNQQIMDAVSLITDLH